MNSKSEIISLYEKYVVPSYLKNGMVLVRGQGSTVWDLKGNEYLDLYPGWGSAPLGHAPKEIAAVLAEQAAQLIHVPNNYFHPWQALLAQAIVEKSFPGKCFFGNSGAEANEGALKCARLFGSKKGKTEVISFENSFHGRTFAALTATGQPKYREGFEPLLEGFRYARFNDFQSVQELVNEKTCSIILEPIQGEGGVYPARPEFLKQLRELCDQKEIVLIFDEVQTGVGRTGEWFACHYYGVFPDIMTLAKGLGGGVPIGAFVARNHLADLMVPGTHASTFGGSPLVCAAALKVLDLVGPLLPQVKKNSAMIFKKLELLKKKNTKIKDIRGAGYLVGIEIDAEIPQLIQQCLEKGILVNRAGKNVIRLLPALNIREDQLEKGLNRLEEVLTHA